MHVHKYTYNILFRSWLSTNSYIYDSPLKRHNISMQTQDKVTSLRLPHVQCVIKVITLAQSGNVGKQCKKQVKHRFNSEHEQIYNTYIYKCTHVTHTCINMCICIYVFVFLYYSCCCCCYEQVAQGCISLA